MSSIGIGLRGPHHADAVAKPHPVDWFEVHSENFFAAGGSPHETLAQICQNYDVSFHGVGLSLGSADSFSEYHLSKLQALISRYQPMLVSEHLSWSSVNGAYLHDLLPLPMTQEVEDYLVSRVEQVQNRLKRQILIENASTYLEFTHSEMPEWVFVSNIANRSGCGILLDVNNVYVNSRNHGFDPFDYLNRIPVDKVQEIHLAGHTVNQLPEGEILIDTHDQRVCAEVWNLYRLAARRFAHANTLIEWDKDLPPFEVLLQEAEIARSIHREMNQHAVA